MTFFFDIANGGYFFQDEASKAMLLIVKFHHDVMFYLVVIFGFTLTILLKILHHFSVSNHYRLSSAKSNVLVLTQDFSAVTWLEVVWTLVPMAILFAIAYPSISLIYKIDTLLEPAVTIKVIGHQWYWSYETNDVLTISKSINSNKQFTFDAYMVPTDDLTVGQFRLLETTEALYLPLDSDVRLIITSTDVLHSWAVPSLGIKVDAVPGRLNQAVTHIFRPGSFYGQCSEICGVNHGFMPIKVIAVDMDVYKAKTLLFA
jgi:cytochrome c oxidase subunit 2